MYVESNEGVMMNERVSGYETPSFTIQTIVSRRLRSLRCFTHFDRVQGWFDKEYDSDAFTVSPVEVVSSLPASHTCNFHRY